MKFPTIAIVGRANVGKSTLFNRIIEEPKALVSPISGTTRDIQAAETTWRGKTFTLLDTGGLDVPNKNEIETQVRLQAEKAIKKARVIIFVIDVRTGLLPQDRVLAHDLKKGKKPVILVANKADSRALQLEASSNELLKLGFGAPLPISATTGMGVGDLLDLITNQLQISAHEKVKPVAKFAIIGRPNVGKSSLLNAILGEERFITSSLPHTTREPVDTLIHYIKDAETSIPLLLIDTAGIRRRARVEQGLESAGVRRSLEMITRADVIFFVLDVSEPITSQDKNLATIILESKKPLIIIANKWDIIRDKMDAQKIKVRHEETKLDKTHGNIILGQLPFLNWAPIIFTSALEKKNVHKIIDLALAINQKMRLEINEPELLAFWEKMRVIPVASKGIKHPRVYSFKQTATNPPVFHVGVRESEPLNPAYLKFLEKRIRQWYDLEGVPITVLSKNIKKGNKRS